MSVYKKEDLERFWSKVDKSGGDESCWLWTAGKHTRGYGRIRFDGKVENAHKVSWLIAYGNTVGSMYIRHYCNTAACCNPTHLYLSEQTTVTLNKYKDQTGEIEKELKQYLRAILQLQAKVEKLRHKLDTIHGMKQ